MYEEYWGLKRAPFDETHSERSFVDSESLQLARIKLRHIATQSLGAAAVIGPPGVGKTALCRQIMRELNAEGWQCAHIVNPVGDARELLCTIITQLGGDSSAQPLNELSRLLDTLGERQQRAAILIDEAHIIDDPDAFEMLRMLLNFETRDTLALTLILCGQETLLPKLEKVSGFNQRLALTIPLGPMNMTESKHYILSRLKIAGCRRGIFTRTAGERLCELGDGLPRQINRLSDMALVVGFGFGLKKIKKDVIDMVARDLGVLPDPNATSTAATAISTKETVIASANQNASAAMSPANDDDDILAAVSGVTPPPAFSVQPMPPAPSAEVEPSSPTSAEPNEEATASDESDDDILASITADPDAAATSDIMANF